MNGCRICRRGARLFGAIWHAVPAEVGVSGAAICGASPYTTLGVGRWITGSNQQVTCPACRGRMARLQRDTPAGADHAVGAAEGEARPAYETG